MGLVTPDQIPANGLITSGGINTPINQLASVINGGIDATNIADSSVTTSKLANGSVNASRLGLATDVQTYTNPGSAGGTFYYINQGGIKHLWGTTTAQNVGTGGLTIILTLPAGFFTTLQKVAVSLDTVGIAPQQFCYVINKSSSSVSIGIISTVNGSTQATAVDIIGT